MNLQDVVVEYFLNRTDRLANLAPWGRPCPIEGNGSLLQIIAAHLGQGAHEALHIPSNGPAKIEPVDRVGSYAPDLEGKTKWVCFDLDGKEHANGLAKPLDAAEQIIERLSGLGFPAHLERSGGGRGFHVWVFFDAKIPAADARLVALSVVPKELRERALENRGVEIFPKQDTVEAGGLGNMVWLPWWAHAPEDCGEFYKASPRGWVSYTPESFERAAAIDVLDYAAELRAKQARESVPPKPSKPATSPNGWAEWRRDVTQALDLRMVYGHLLTGKKGGKGWLQCRLADSEDPHPSASVADSARNAERGTYHNLVTGESLRLIDFMLRYGGATSIGDANRKLAEWTGIPMPNTAAKKASSPPAPAEPPKRVERPSIIVNGRQVLDVIRDGWSALMLSERPKIYVRNGELVRIRDGENGKRIHPMTRDSTHGALMRSATWVRVKQSEQSGTYYVDDKPNPELAADMLSYPHPSLPRLEAVLTAPSFSHDGRLIDRPGFDEDAAIFYDEIEQIPPVLEAPTTDDVLAAKLLIEDDLFVDFPWTSQADKASAWCALLLPFVRRMVSGSTPLHLIEAPTAGSGKGLLADIVCLTFTGQEAEVTTLPTDEEETRKKLTSVLRAGKPIITFDNLPYGSKSATLAAMLTSHTWSDRKMGVQEMIEMTNRAVWITTVNNPDFNVDLARRCIRIRIAPDAGRPWERAVFKHPALREWVRSNRHRIVHALLTLIRYWVSLGMPRGTKTLGSFESWSRIMGGILDHIGVPGFLENTRELYDQADTDSAEWSEFVRCWWAVHDNEPATARQLVDLAKQHDLLLTVRGDRGPSSQSIRMGKALARMRGRVVDGWRIEMRANPHSKSREYVLEPMTEEARAPLYLRDLQPEPRIPAATGEEWAR